MDVISGDNGAAVQELYTFLLRDALKPIPNYLSIEFLVNQTRISLQSNSISGRMTHRMIPLSHSSLADCLTRLFEVVSVDSIVNMLLLLLLEEKILLVSNRLSILPEILEGLLLLLPYSWPHAFIPITPFYLLPILIDSPSPFIFGTSITTYSYVQNVVPKDIHVIFVKEDCQCPCPSIPPLPKQWLINKLITIHSSGIQFVNECKQAVNAFFWMLLPSFSKYLFTLLANLCLFNNIDYIANEVSEEYRGFYTRLLATQVFPLN